MNIIIADWMKLFPARILFRGQEYCDSELVKITSADDGRIEAVVEGSESYSVRIDLEDGEAKQMRCDCPYASDGRRCKHMAAVLFAVTGYRYSPLTGPSSARTKEKQDDLATAVASLSEEQVRALLAEAAKKHRDIGDRISFIGKQSVDASVRNRWKEDIRGIRYGAADRHGFIDYRHAGSYCSDLDGYLRENVPMLISYSMISDAFYLVGLVFVEAMSSDIDDSDGGLSFIASECESYWKEMLRSPKADQQAMFKWFSRQIDRFSGDFAEDSLLQVVLEGFTDRKLLPKILDLLDQRISSAREYSLPALIGHRVAVMKKLGATAEETDGYRKKFWRYPFIREQELDRLEAAKQWNEALSLIDECEKLDSDEWHLMSGYSERRVRILKLSGNEGEWLKALERHVFGFHQNNMTHILELKSAVTPERWKELLEQLFQNRHTRELRREIQLSEGMHEQMMSELESESTLYEVKEYEKELRKIYPGRVRDLLLKLLNEQMRKSNTRSEYANVIRILMLLYGYPDGRAKAAELASSWRREYPRRTAMLDELDRAKL